MKIWVYKLGYLHFHQIIVIIIGEYSQLCHLLPNFHDFLSSAHMILSVRSVRSGGIEVLIKQILCRANFMLIGQQYGIHDIWLNDLTLTLG